MEAAGEDSRWRLKSKEWVTILPLMSPSVSLKIDFSRSSKAYAWTQINPSEEHISQNNAFGLFSPWQPSGGGWGCGKSRPSFRWKGAGVSLRAKIFPIKYTVHTGTPWGPQRDARFGNKKIDFTYSFGFALPPK